jgi:hypothetical protein
MHTYSQQNTASQVNGVFCPTCGSNHITLRSDANISWGRAATGWLLFGPVGAAVGAMTGQPKTSNACLNCGESWKASDLFITTQAIKTLLGVELNLSKNSHREYLSAFMLEIAPHISRIEETKQCSEKKIDIVSKQPPSEISGWVGYACGIGFITGLLQGAIVGWPQGRFFAPIQYALGWSMLVFFAAIIVDVLTGGSRRSVRKSKQSIQEKIHREHADAKKQLEAAKSKLLYQIENFSCKYATLIAEQ